MDRVTRSKLKTDRFAVEVEHSVEYVSEHRKQVSQYAAGLAAVALIAAGIWYYRDRRHIARQDELSAAMDVMQAPVAPNGPPGQLFYTTDELKSTAAVKAFKSIYEKHGSSQEGVVAASYLGALFTDQGNLAEAEKYFLHVIDEGDKNLASTGKLSLSQIYLNSGRQADAEKLLRSLYEKPTAFVSKEQAAIALARAISNTKPAEARKLLEPLRTGRPAISQTAITLLSQLPQQ